jgi:hypothetical protein
MDFAPPKNLFEARLFSSSEVEAASFLALRGASSCLAPTSSFAVGTGASVYLASPLASFVTGNVLVVDGRHYLEGAAMLDAEQWRMSLTASPGR